MNAVAVVEPGRQGAVTGYIPAGWYPTAVVAAPYKRLLVADAKGTHDPQPQPRPERCLRPARPAELPTTPAGSTT